MRSKLWSVSNCLQFNVFNTRVHCIMLTYMDGIFLLVNIHCGVCPWKVVERTIAGSIVGRLTFYFIRWFHCIPLVWLRQALACTYHSAGCVFRKGDCLAYKLKNKRLTNKDSNTGAVILHPSFTKSSMCSYCRDMKLITFNCGNAIPSSNLIRIAFIFGEELNGSPLSLYNNDK